MDQPLSTLQRLWLAALVLVQLVFAFLLPAFNGNDERGHTIRTWALVEGHFSCTTIPSAVRAADSMRAVHKGESISAYFKRGLATAGGAQAGEDLVAGEHSVDGWDYECAYFPLGLVAPALATRLTAKTISGHLRPGGVFIASYAARLALLITVDLALLYFLYALSGRARHTALAFFSIPMMVQQSFNVGHDAYLLVVTLLVVCAALRPPSWRAVAFIEFAVATMSIIKPVYCGYALLALPMLVRLYQQAQPSSLQWPQWMLVGGLLVPALVYKAWRTFSKDAQRYWMPSFAHPDKQAQYLIDHPLHIFRVFGGYLHYFIDDHVLPDFYPRLINGKWTSMFGVFATADFEMAKPGYLLILSGLVLAIAADIFEPSGNPPAKHLVGPTTLRVRLAWLLAMAGVLVQVPLTVVALYMVFSHVGANGPYGVQGRYHLPTLFVLLVVGIHYARARLKITRNWYVVAVILGGVFCLTSDGYALVAVYRHYYP